MNISQLFSGKRKKFRQLQTERSTVITSYSIHYTKLYEFRSYWQRCLSQKLGVSWENRSIHFDCRHPRAAVWANGSPQINRSITIESRNNNLIITNRNWYSNLLMQRCRYPFFSPNPSIYRSRTWRCISLFVKFNGCLHNLNYHAFPFHRQTTNNSTGRSYHRNYFTIFFID